MTLPLLRSALALAAALLMLWPAPAAAQDAPDGPPAPDTSLAGASVVDGIAAVVGDEVILRSEVDVLAASLLQRGVAEAYSDELWMDALDELINQQVLSEQAQQDTTIRVSDEQLEQRLDQRVQQMAAQVGGEAELEEIYGQSILQLKNNYRDDFRQQLMAQQLQQTRLQEIDITPSEVRAWFEQIPEDSLPRLPETVRLAHVVRYPKISEEAEQESLEIIQAVRDSITQRGAAIEDMARRFSDDPRSARSGGRIQNVALQDLYPEFAAVASRLPVDSLSEPVRTPIGYHLIRVNQRTGNTVDLNHVLIRIDERDADPTETVAYLSSVRDSLIRYDQVPFELMAQRHSEEEISAPRGGRVVAPQSGQRDLVLERLGLSWQQTIDTMEVGEISRPAEVELLSGRRGYHIVLLQERAPAHQISFATDYTRIREYALQEKRARELQQWLDELREQVYVDVRIRPEDLAAARR